MASADPFTLLRQVLDEATVARSKSEFQEYKIAALNAELLELSIYLGAREKEHDAALKALQDESAAEREQHKIDLRAAEGRVREEMADELARPEYSIQARVARQRSTSTSVPGAQALNSTYPALDLSRFAPRMPLGQGEYQSDSDSEVASSPVPAKKRKRGSAA